jgi:hypothetical protein
MSCTISRVHVHVDEARRHKLPGSVDFGVQRPVIPAAYINIAAAFLYVEAVADERMSAAGNSNDPSAPNNRAHRLLQWLKRSGRVR